MILRRSGFIHLISLSEASVLVIHAISQVRLTVTPQVATVIDAFRDARLLEDVLGELATALGVGVCVIRGCVESLVDRGILCEQNPAEEEAAIARELTGLHGRDPTALLDRHRRACLEGSHPYWSVAVPRGLDDTRALSRRVDLLLLGDCDVQMEADFLRQEAARRGIDLRVAASFAADTGLAAERKHDAVVIGALQARHAIVVGEPRHHDGDPARVYVDAVATMVTKLRAVTGAPILIDGLPEPTVQPLGFADRGVHSHRNRLRRTNLALAEFAEDHPDVHLVDVAAEFAAEGSAALLDDGLVGFTHFGSLGWMLQRPDSELAATHSQFPDMQTLAEAVGGDPYRREALMARAHMDALTIVLGLERKKCVIVDLDGVLWPGVLAETGSPFAWQPEISGPNSYIGLYFGIHEALLALRRRGILLACVSKNDEATIRALWRYQQADPRHRLLLPEHFVCTRINWDDKAENIRSIADELGFPLDAFVFVDDTARERERVRDSLPGVTVLGDDLFSLRRTLLTDSRLQPAHVTEEAARRSTLVKAQLDRTRLHADIPDEAKFIASLQVVCTVECLTLESPDRERVRELFGRTTQFNATGRGFTGAELQEIIGRADGRAFTLRIRDRLGDHGLVGAVVAADGEILNFVMSCRVIGLGGERALLASLTHDPGAGVRKLVGRIIPSDRNLPVRHLYTANGFVACGPNAWEVAVGETDGTSAATGPCGTDAVAA